MGDFFDKLREAESEFNVLDRAMVLSFGKFLTVDTSGFSQLWPDVEPLVEGAVVGTPLELAYDRENAAKGRRAGKAAAFFSFVVEALVRMIEETAENQ